MNPDAQTDNSGGETVEEGPGGAAGRVKVRIFFRCLRPAVNQQSQNEAQHQQDLLPGEVGRIDELYIDCQEDRDRDRGGGSPSSEETEEDPQGGRSGCKREQPGGEGSVAEQGQEGHLHNVKDDLDGMRKSRQQVEEGFGYRNGFEPDKSPG